MPDPARPLQLIRATRSAPPGLAAGNHDRQRTYGAALQQFEELLAAAQTAGPASRSLPLFYALEQSGRALVAVHAPSGTTQYGSHGLGVESNDFALPLQRVAVVPKGTGSFQAVASATGSAPLTGPVELGALWASLPESGNERLAGSSHPSALLVAPQEPFRETFSFTHTERARALVCGLPESVTTAPPEGRLEALATCLAAYPGAARWESPFEGNVSLLDDPVAGAVAQLQWRLPEAVGSSGQRWDFLMSTIAPSYNSHQHGYLRPVVGAGGDHPSPLMTWWALLFALSMFARYKPAEWVQLLNVDRSADATVVESILTQGLEAVPRLVLGAIQGAPYLTVT